MGAKAEPWNQLGAIGETCPKKAWEGAFESEWK